MDSLAPPRKSVELVDPGAHDLDTYEENLQTSPDVESSTTPQIPMLRVEKTDDKASRGEVPGTIAYDMRTRDAAPDEMEAISDGLGSSSPATSEPGMDQRKPAGLSIPQTVVEKVDPGSPSHGEVPGTAAYDIRKADAEPDMVLTAPEITRTDLEAMPTSRINRYSDRGRQTHLSKLNASSVEDDDEDAEDDEQHQAEEDGVFPTNSDLRIDDVANEDNEGFGEDFDDFEEGADHEDFGAFEDSSVHHGTIETPVPNIHVPRAAPKEHPRLPMLDFSSLSSLENIVEACQPYLNELYPALRDKTELQQPPLEDINTSFLTERSQSLWAQLVAPPPLQPPDWVRSRIRRLFLVSLGVPVDLDEILPASKQKKLVLPSVNIDRDRSPSRVAEVPPNGAVASLKDNNASTISINSSAARTDRRKRGPAPPPELDINAARLLCSMTDAALGNLTSEELQDHISYLEELTRRTSELLEYWLIQRNSAVGDKEAFEEVIENLVKHAQKIRK